MIDAKEVGRRVSDRMLSISVQGNHIAGVVAEEIGRAQDPKPKTRGEELAEDHVYFADGNIRIRFGTQVWACPCGDSGVHGMILVPQSLATAYAEEQVKAQAVEDDRQHNVAKACIKAFLQKDAILVTDPQAIAAIRQLCGRLLNMNRITSVEKFTPSEIGRLVSDVLLGEGQDYEVKT